MNYNQYQAEALTTAVYPLERELDYTVIGLFSEVADLAQWVDTVDQHSTNDWMRHWASDLGDCWWYTAALADALKTTLGEIQTEFAPLLATTKSETTQKPLQGAYHALIAASGELAGLLKKSIRDNSGYVTPVRAGLMREKLALVTAHLDVLGEMEGMSRHRIWNANLNKLADRKTCGLIAVNRAASARR